MKKTILLLTAMIFAVSMMQAQGLYGKKQKPNLTFYSDEAATQEISVINPGQSTFYVKMPLRAKDFKFPLGKFAAYADYNFLQRRAEVQDIKSGFSTKDEMIYSEDVQMEEGYGAIVQKQEEMIIKFDLTKDINFENNLNEVVEAGSKTYPLTVWIGDEDEPLGYGVIDWDLSDGGTAYKAAELAKRANYTFNLDDGVTDPEFKATVKKDMENRRNITIYQMAHGERVPYERDLTWYRRNQFGITFKDLDENKCYTGGVAAFEVSSKRTGPWTYENDGNLNYGDEIPCDRVDK